MSNKKTAVIDVDGVLANFDAGFRDALKSWGHEHPMPTPTKWHFADQWGLTDAQFLRFFDLFTSDLGYGRLPLMPQNRVEGYEDLYKNHTVHIATSLPIQAIQDRLYWLEINNFKYHQISFLKEKWRIRADFYLDDCTENLQAIRDHGIGMPVCFDQPWNQDWKGLRVRTLKEFEFLISVPDTREEFLKGQQQQIIDGWPKWDKGPWAIKKEVA